MWLLLGVDMQGPRHALQQRDPVRGLRWSRRRYPTSASAHAIRVSVGLVKEQ